MKEAIAGAKVKGLPGGTKTTDAKGTVTTTLRKSGSFTLTATKPGYVAAKGTVSV